MKKMVSDKTFNAFKKWQEEGVVIAKRPGRRDRPCDEGMGDPERRNVLYPLVPADDRPHRRKTRQFHQLHRPRARSSKNSPDQADPGRTRRIVLSFRRHQVDFRSPRLYGLGPFIAGVHRRSRRRQNPLHPDDFHLLYRRSARQETAASAQRPGDQQGGVSSAQTLRS